MRIMLDIHSNGIAECGRYGYEEAKAKVERVNDLYSGTPASASLCGRASSLDLNLPRCRAEQTFIAECSDHAASAGPPQEARARPGKLIERHALAAAAKVLLRTRIRSAVDAVSWAGRWSATMAVPMCCFCGRTVDQVTHLIQGPELFICDICVDACVDTLATKDHGWRERQIDYLLRLKNRRAPAAGS